LITKFFGSVEKFQIQYYVNVPKKLKSKYKKFIAALFCKKNTKIAMYAAANPSAPLQYNYVILYVIWIGFFRYRYLERKDRKTRDISAKVAAKGIRAHAIFLGTFISSRKIMYLMNKAEGSKESRHQVKNVLYLQCTWF